MDSKIFDADDNLIWDEADNAHFPEISRPPGLGAPDECVEGDKITPNRCVYFYNGGICIKHPDSIDARGDINLNGVAYEIADAVVLTNYFIFGPAALTVNPDGQIAASDVNADGYTLTIADLVYLIRVIVGDADPIPRPSPYLREMTLGVSDSGNKFTVKAETDIRAGAGLLVFEYDNIIPQTPLPGSMSEGMELGYNITDNEIRVLIYSFETGQSIGLGSGDLVNIDYSGDGNIRLVDVSFATFHGDAMRTNIDELLIPNAFEVSQNYPNPFNPSTRIDLRIPSECNWEMIIYNIHGRAIRHFEGESEAGITIIEWDGRDDNGNSAGSGIYLYKVSAGNHAITKKMTLLK
jgi:hypothetical protein